MKQLCTISTLEIESKSNTLDYDRVATMNTNTSRSNVRTVARMTKAPSADAAIVPARHSPLAWSHLNNDSIEDVAFNEEEVRC